MTQKVKKIIVIACISTAALSFAFSLGLFFHLQNVSPKVPNNISGEIYPLNDHGYIFYVTEFYCYLHYSSMIISLPLAACGFMLNERWHVLRNDYEELRKSKLY